MLVAGSAVLGLVGSLVGGRCGLVLGRLVFFLSDFFLSARPSGSTRIVFIIIVIASRCRIGCSLSVAACDLLRHAIFGVSGCGFGELSSLILRILASSRRVAGHQLLQVGHICRSLV